MLCASCTVEKTNGHITGNIEIDKDSILLLYNYKSNEISDTIEIKDGIFNFSYQITYPEIRYIEYQGIGQDVYLTPNGNTIVEFANGNFKIKNKESQLVDSLNMVLNEIRIYDSQDLTTDKVCHEIDSLYTVIQNTFNSKVNQQNLSESTSEFINNTIDFYFLTKKAECGLWHSVKDTSYYSFLKTKEIDNDKNIGIPQFRQFLDKYIAVKIIVLGPDSINALQPKKLFKSAVDYRTHFKSQKIQEYICFHYSHQYLQYFGIDDFKELETVFKLNNTDSVYAKQLKKTYDFKNRLSRGKIAPEFSCVDLKGDSVSLKDFRGKYVLIDFWSSGCRPCREELPYLIDLQKTSSSNIEILSISLESNIQDWKNAVQQHQTNGIHLFAGGEDLRTKYQIMGIPSFVLIDKEGKILNSQPPRPSSPELKKLLEQLSI